MRVEGLLEKTVTPSGFFDDDLGPGPVDVVTFLDHVLGQGRLLRLEVAARCFVLLEAGVKAVASLADVKFVTVSTVDLVDNTALDGLNIGSLGKPKILESLFHTQANSVWAINRCDEFVPSVFRL